MNRLAEILTAKRAEIETLRPRAGELRREALQRNDFRSFSEALRRTDGRLAVIAEVKKASPSAGVIADSFDPVEIAAQYERAGASAISVLTDEKFFQGRLQYLSDIRERVDLPVLRKDFILDEVQIAEAAAAGADAILLIVAALDDDQLTSLLDAAGKYQLDALVEVHTREELDRAVDAGAQIIGINNRNLATFEVDLATTEILSEEAPNDVLLVSESGISQPGQIEFLKKCGVNAVLVGEALMRGKISIPQLRS